MIASTMWAVTRKRLSESRPLQVLAVICAADYLGYLYLAASERIEPTFAFVLFLFSGACWFWAVTWPPFWNHLTLRWQNRATRKRLSFVERFGMVSLFFVQGVYTVMLVMFLFGLGVR